MVMNTAICPYYENKLLRDSISFTTSINEKSVLEMARKLGNGYIVSVKTITLGLGRIHSRVYRTPYKPVYVKHIPRSPGSEPEFAVTEALKNTTGLTDIFRIYCEKDPELHSDEFLIISDDIDEYDKGFFVFLNMHGGYESLQRIIDIYVEHGWKRDETIETIKRFLNYEYFMHEWHYATYFEKLRRVAAKDLHLLGLDTMPELVSDKFNNVA